MATSTEPATLGARLRALRLATGCTVEEIAERASMSVEELTRLENDAVSVWPHWETVSLARVYGVGLGELVGGSGDGKGERI